MDATDYLFELRSYPAVSQIKLLQNGVRPESSVSIELKEEGSWNPSGTFYSHRLTLSFLDLQGDPPVERSGVYNFEVVYEDLTRILLARNITILSKL